jgi:hypothetical protein
MAIEHYVPDVPDGEVQLADGVLDLGCGAVLADQRPRGFQVQPRREDPAHHYVVQSLRDSVMIFGQAQCRLRRVGCRRGAATGPRNWLRRRFWYCCRGSAGRRRYAHRSGTSSYLAVAGRQGPERRGELHPA